MMALKEFLEKSCVEISHFFSFSADYPICEIDLSSSFQSNKLQLRRFDEDVHVTLVAYNRTFTRNFIS